MQNFLIEVLNLSIEMGFYLMIGLFFVGLLHVFVKKKWIAKQLGKESLGSVVKASLFGVPLPLCSCGVIPTTVYLKNNGAYVGAVISFLVSTPQTGIDSIVATYGMMGYVFAIYRPLVALVTGVIAGVIIGKLFKNKVENIDQLEEEHSHGDGCCEDSCNIEISDEEKKLTFIEKIKAMFKYAYIDFLDDIVYHLIIGILISALISVFIPADFFENYNLKSGLLTMLVMIAIGLPMYICSTSSIPVAMTLMAKGISPGAAFVFLFVGPVTNAASLTVLGKTLGKKVIVVYTIIVSILAIVFGYLLDFIFIMGGFEIKDMIMKHAHVQNDWFKLTIFGIFVLLAIRSIVGRITRKLSVKSCEVADEDNNGGIEMETVKIGIEGMSCNHCVNNVKASLEKMEGVTSVDVSLDQKHAMIEGKNLNKEMMIAKVNELGYQAK